MSSWHRWIFRVATSSGDASAVHVKPEVFRRVNPVEVHGHRRCVLFNYSGNHDNTLTDFVFFLRRYKLHKLESQSKSEDGSGFAALLGEGRYTLRLTFEMTGAAEFLSVSSLECIGFPIEIGIVRMYPGTIR